LYDDVYMDLTFVQVFDTHGLDAPDSLHAKYFANAGYPLWHANQAARYNILNGIMPPESGHWKNNPHADDIDFQIEADFAGLMSPGMVNAASEIAWKIGHIMNYGDGVYGGIYVAAMYALAFVHDDIEFIVEEALKSIPKQSNYYQCIADVIRCYREDPNDWKKAWFEAQKKWTADIGCPDGVFCTLQHRCDHQRCLHRHWPALRQGRLRRDHRYQHAVRVRLGLQPGQRGRDTGHDDRVRQDTGLLEAGAG
jgi:hypothetical protein